MASLRLSAILRGSARHFHLSRYTVPSTSPVLPRRVFTKSPTQLFAKANASTTANTGTSTSEDAAETMSSSPSPSANSVEGGNHFRNENGDGELSSISLGNGSGIGEFPTDWSKSYHGLSSVAFSKDIAEFLQSPVDPLDIEMKPDGLIYLPEIKYRRILNKAFGPGAWGLAPRSETRVDPKIVSREYALVCQGRLVAIARGEQDYFDPSGVPTATEGCKSNALMRCCKDLGIASELWDPRFVREFKAKYCVEVFAEHLPTKKKKKLWRRKDQPKFTYPYQE